MNKKILIIDDERDLTELMGLFLRETGWEVFAANDGEEGIKKSREVIPDLIFLDFVMPRCKGNVVLERLRKDPSTRNIPVVIMSGLGQQVYFGGKMTGKTSVEDQNHSGSWAVTTDGNWSWTPEDIREDYGVVAYLPKPFDKGILLEVFREVSAEIGKEKL